MGALSAGPATVMIFFRPVDTAAIAKNHATGVKLSVSSVRRNPPECVETRAKVTSKMNQILAELDVPELHAERLAKEAAVATSRAMVETAKARLKLKQVNFNLIKDLVAQSARTQAQLDESGAERALAEAQVSLAQAQQREAESRLQTVRVLLGYLQLRAPFAGVVTSRFADPGAFVRSGQEGGAKPILEVQRSDTIRCVVEIPERDAILVLQSFRNKTLHAELKIDALHGMVFDFEPERLSQVARFSHSIHPQSHHMIAAIDLDNTDGNLIPGLFGKVTLMARGVAKSDVVLLPNTAIQAPRKGKTHVFVVQGGAQSGEAVVKKEIVSLGVTDGSLTEVSNGLKGGVVVVLHGAGTLLDGQTVRVRDASAIRRGSR